MLTADGEPKLTDFGLARHVDSDDGHTKAGSALGTLDFMPLEQRHAAATADARSDLWSLAATFYQMLTGRIPKVIRLNDLSSGFQSVLGKALADGPNDRYQSASEFKQAIRDAMRSAGVAAGAALEVGTCPSCGAENDPTRKFCRSCAVSMRIDCLKCGEAIPVWEDVCGECGKRQSELLRESVEQKLAEAEAEAEAAARAKAAEAKVAAAARAETAAREKVEALFKKHMTPAQLELGDPFVDSIGMVLVPILAGRFQMGSPDSDKAAPDIEKPRHLVNITKPFYLSVHQVTQQQYERVMSSRPWHGMDNVQIGPDYPTTYVCHDNAVEFCRKLSETEGVEYRLPTEAEWEYACRAGTTTVYSFGNDASKLGEYAWFRKNAYDVDEEYAHRVGQKLPNPWGLHDMHGNVFEWCQDWYARYGRMKWYSPFEVLNDVCDPMGPAQGDRRLRLLRGGSFLSQSSVVRSAYRLSYQSAFRNDLIGFRPARTYP